MKVLDTKCEVQVEIDGQKEWKSFISVAQLARKTKRYESQIRAMLRSLGKDGKTRLTAIYPFPNKDNEEGSGQMFVLIDVKCEKFIQSCRKRNQSKG